VESLINLLRDLIGNVPAGLEFLEYLFSFILVVFGLFIIGYVAHLPFEFIRNRFHK
jgi:hypothetical protein